MEELIFFKVWELNTSKTINYNNHLLCHLQKRPSYILCSNHSSLGSHQFLACYSSHRSSLSQKHLKMNFFGKEKTWNWTPGKSFLALSFVLVGLSSPFHCLILLWHWMNVLSHDLSSEVFFREVVIHLLPYLFIRHLLLSDYLNWTLKEVEIL